jgi:hypothetical protein
MICPKCGFEQPESVECMRCGVIVGRYRGPVAAVAAQAAAFAPPGSGHETVRIVLPPSPPPPLAESIFREKPSFKEPEPEAPADGGTVYGGPPPPPPGGTVYSGPAPGTPAAMAAAGRGALSPVFSVTQKLRTGEILSESFAVYFKNIIPFVLLTAVAFSPVYFLLAAFSRQYAETHPVAALEASGLVGLATFLFCLPISTAGITYGVFQQMSGQDTSLGTCLSVGFSSLLRVLAVAILQILLVMGAVILTAIPIGFLIGMMVSGGTRSSAACSIMLLPLLLLCYVPALMLWLKYFVAIPAAVEERPGTMESLRRSAFLTSGQRWPIFGALLVLGVLYVGLLLTARLVPVAGPVIETLGGLLMLGLSATISAVIYYRLRSFHESIDVDQIASVFA